MIYTADVNDLDCQRAIATCLHPDNHIPFLRFGAAEPGQGLLGPFVVSMCLGNPEDTGFRDGVKSLRKALHTCRCGRVVHVCVEDKPNSINIDIFMQHVYQWNRVAETEDQ